MKHFTNYSLVLIALCILIPAFEVYGESIGIDILEESNDYSEVANLEDSIIEVANYFYPSQIARRIEPDDIDYNKIVKEYMGSEVLNLKSSDEKTIKKDLDEGRYIWLLPIHIETSTILVNIVKPFPIVEEDLVAFTDEEKKEVYENDGKWIVGPVYAFQDQIIDYNKTLNQALDQARIHNEVTDVMLVGSIPNIWTPIAIGFDGGKAKYIIPAQEESAAAFHNSDQRSVTMVSDNQFQVYDFDKVVTASKNMPKFEEDEYGGSPGIDMAYATKNKSLSFRMATIIVSMVILCICVILLIAKQIFIYRNKNNLRGY